MKKRQVVVKSGCSSRGRRVVRYGECQKNHAANIGGYAVDGCREFMANGAAGTPSALICAACSCHRNFHRKEDQDTTSSSTHTHEVVCEYSPPN